MEEKLRLYSLTFCYFLPLFQELKNRLNISILFNFRQFFDIQNLFLLRQYQVYHASIGFNVGFYGNFWQCQECYLEIKLLKQIFPVSYKIFNSHLQNGTDNN